MSDGATDGRRSRSALRRSWRVALMALVLAAFGAGASAAYGANVDIVDQGGPPAGKLPPHVHYFTTIQAAVEFTKPGDWVLVKSGVYNEQVKVTSAHHGIWIRGLDRNNVILDGQGKPGNGVEVYKAINVYVENLTARNFETGEGPGCEHGCGNGFWWNGGGGSNKIGAHGWWGRYLTAYDTGFGGGYGISTNNETEGEWENIYASGYNDSGMYLGACPECKAVINKATMENNALGYSGSNSGGNLIIENSTISHNSDGIVPNSENPGDGPPPQNGACNPVKPYTPFHKVLPKFSSTEIEHCTIIRNNLIENNDNLTTPINGSTGPSPFGIGIQLPGDYGDLIEGNTIKNNPANGVAGFEYPNPFPPTANTIYFQFTGNKIANNKFEGNGTLGAGFAGDVMLAGGLFGTQTSTNNCLSGNSFTAAVYPAEIEKTWGCQNKTTPNPVLGLEGVGYLLYLQELSLGRTSVAQPAPPAQPTMPNPCAGVPSAPPVCP